MQQGPDYSPTPSTHWSLIDRVRDGDPQLARAAMEQLLRRYLPAMRSYLLCHRKLAPDHADDLLQGFIADEVLDRQLVGRADRQRGRFRGLLLTALSRYVAMDFRRRSALKRAPENAASIDDIAPPSRPEGADLFDAAWAKLVLEQAIVAMRAECAAAGREDLWRLFELRILNPAIDGAEAPPYELLQRHLCFQTPRQAANAMITARRMFVRHLRGVVADYAGDSSAIDEEIDDLHRILAAGAPSA